MSVLTSAVTLILLYRLGRALYSPSTGLTAAALLAVQPTFVFWSRQGVFVTFVTAPLTLGALLCGWRWWRGNGRPITLYAGAFLLGLALAAKLLTLWVVAGVGGAFVLLYIRQVWQAFQERSLAPLGISLSWSQFGLVALSFALGMTMLIAYNVQTGGTWRIIRENLGTSYYGVDNRAVFNNLVERFIGLKVVLTGEHFWYLGGVYSNRYWPWVLPLAGMVALGFVLWRKPEQWRSLLFPFLSLTLMTIASIFTVSALWFTHFALIIPWPALALAVALTHIARLLDPRWLGGGLAAVIVTGLVVTDIQIDRDYHTDLHNTWGYGAHSGAIYALAEQLEAEGDPSPYALDWGIQDPIQFLTEGQINPIELTGFEFEPGEAFTERVTESLDDPGALYILHAPEETRFQRRAAFEHVIAEQDFEIAEEDMVYDISGRPIFVLLRLTPAD
jgi:4-amino-4-deoxy-L-arabinose transferase-like glycosyltransferase